MKPNLILMFTILAVLLSLTGCSNAAEPTAIEISCDNFAAENHISRTIEVAAGDSFTVTLCANPTTGFEWEDAEISDPAILDETANEYVAPEASGMVGASGKEVWTFKALKKGTCTVDIEYSRPWEGGEQGEWTFTLEVTVK